MRKQRAAHRGVVLMGAVVWLAGCGAPGGDTPRTLELGMESSIGKADHDGKVLCDNAIALGVVLSRSGEALAKACAIPADLSGGELWIFTKPAGTRDVNGQTKASFTVMQVLANTGCILVSAYTGR